MKLLEKISAIVLLVCFTCQIQGYTELLPDDEASQGNNDDFASESANTNIYPVAIHMYERVIMNFFAA